MKNKIILDLDFTNLEICVNHIKKEIIKNTIKKVTTWSTQLLEFIHTDVCRPFDVPSFIWEKYFIIFINNISHYNDVNLLCEKSQSINTLEIFINDVERLLYKKVKIIRYDTSGECYWRHEESRQCLCLFGKFLKKKYDIFAQYIMPNTS